SVRERTPEKTVSVQQKGPGRGGKYLSPRPGPFSEGSRGKSALRTCPPSPGSLSSLTHARSPAVRPATYLVFGDLHGRVLPAFRLAQAWSREHGVALAGLLQAGALGEFPGPGRCDRATKRRADKGALEDGVRLVAQPSAEADAVFAGGPCPGALWFTAGNHEDYDSLKAWE